MTWMISAAAVIAVLYLSYGVLFYGARKSLSQLGVDWQKWLFTLFIWTETALLLPSMFDTTQENLQPLVFFIGAGLLLTGAASVTDKYEEAYHNAGAWVSCAGSLVWLALINPIMLFIPLFAVISGGYDRWQWSGEIGIITAIITTLL